MIVLDGLHLVRSLSPRFFLYDPTQKGSQKRSDILGIDIFKQRVHSAHHPTMLLVVFGSLLGLAIMSHRIRRSILRRHSLVPGTLVVGRRRRRRGGRTDTTRFLCRGGCAVDHGCRQWGWSCHVSRMMMMMMTLGRFCLFSLHIKGLFVFVFILRVGNHNSILLFLLPSSSIAGSIGNGWFVCGSDQITNGMSTKDGEMDDDLQ
jgi:hypothetical protein